jgi:hypothetical protein
MYQDAFKQFRRSQIAELRPYVPGEDLSALVPPVSISGPDKEAGSPKPGDMIARNPANHDDQWLVTAKYFADNFEPVHSAAHKETSSRVSSIAARFVNLTADDYGKPNIAQFYADIRTLAGSCLSQDETPGDGETFEHKTTATHLENDNG